MRETLLICAIGCVLGNAAFQLFGDGDYLAGIERTWFQWQALLVMWLLMKLKGQL